MRYTLYATAAVAALVSAMPAQAAAGDWLVRLRAIIVAPNESSGPVTPSFPGANVTVNNAYTGELDFTYMATNNIGAELVLATTKHSVSGAGTLSGVGKLASSWVLPPTLTLQYHFMPEAHVRPYVGAGVNYTIFYSTDASSQLEAAVGPTNVHMNDSFGWALQAGLDFDISPKLFLNADIKYIDMSTKATLTSGALVNTVNVKINPIVAGIGIGMRF